MVRKIVSSFAGQLILVLLALAIVSACSMETRHSQHNPSPALASSQWRLVSLNNAAVTNTARPLTLGFEAGKLSGFSGCNRFFGNYTSSRDGVFSAGPIGATKMACGGEQDLLEQQYLNRLAQARQYAVSVGQLQLLDAAHNVLLTFDADKPAASKPSAS